MILFFVPHYGQMAHSLAQTSGLHVGYAVLVRFPNRELYADVETEVHAQDCVMLGSVAPPDEELLSMLLLCHTLKKEGARRILALLPYLGYARQDREEAGRSLGAAWIGALLQACGAEEVVTVDVHSPLVQTRFPIPLFSLSPAAIFGGELKRLGLHRATLVAPDEGALERCEAVRQAAGIEAPVAYFEKQRTAAGVKHLAMHGEVGAQAVVVDDILDTGGTLLACCEALQRAGVQEIVVMVTHGLFTGTEWERLWSLGVTRLYCTDSVPLPTRLAEPRISVLSVVPLLTKYLSDRR